MSKRRINVIGVRLNKREYDLLQARLEKSGLSQSAILRNAFLEHPDTLEAMKELDKTSGYLEGISK